MSTTSLRWAVNVGAWAPSQEQWGVALAALPEQEQARCLRFRQPEDQRRAVVSQLLQRACICAVLGVGWQDASIARTRGAKPFYAGPADRTHAPNFNYNVSHEGDYVVLASEGTCLVGVDVAAPQQLRRGSSTRPLLEVLGLMRKQLSDSEWALLQSLADDEAAAECAFQAMWSCKEAFIKARGDGVAFEPLSRIRAQLPDSFVASIRSSGRQRAPQGHPVQRLALEVDGAPADAWRAYLQRLPNRHWVCVARGPPSAAVDALGEFRATMQQPDIPADQLQALLDAPSPAFDLLCIEDLLPPHAQQAYEAAGS